MAKNYEKGDKYYLPVVVDEIVYGDNYPVKLTFLDGGGGDSVGIADEPGLLLTADEIIIQAQDNDKARYEELRKLYERDVTKLGGEIKTLRYENERLSKQNEELGAKVDDLEADLQNAKAAIDHYHEVEHRRVGYTDRQTQAINRKDKEIEILIDRITKLEAELAEERERKKNG